MRRGLACTRQDYDDDDDDDDDEPCKPFCTRFPTAAHKHIIIHVICDIIDNNIISYCVWIVKCIKLYHKYNIHHTRVS